MTVLPQKKLTIGILYPGEMGCALARALVGPQQRVLTTIAGRSPRTVQNARNVGFEIRPSLAAVAAEADILVSLVTPTAAVQLAEDYCRFAQTSSHKPIYIDANSVSPLTAMQIAEMLEATDTPFVDAAIHGLASRLQEQGTLYLSGTAAGEVAEFFGNVLRVIMLGDAPGKASAFKMMLGGMSKGLVALFLDMAMLARQQGMLDELLAEYRKYYPGIIDALTRLVPTYPQHAARRSEEMAELERTIRACGLSPGMISAARDSLANIGHLDLTKWYPERSTNDWTIAQTVETIFQLSNLEGHVPAWNAEAPLTH